MANHVLLDLETLGTRPGDCILSIGAVVFSLDEGITSEFYVTVDSNRCRELGFKAQKSTVEWWGKQSKVAQEAAFKGELSPETAFKQFTMWLPEDTTLWGNGADFDNVLMTSALNLLKIEVPWKFWNNRCYRTVKNLFPMTLYQVFRVFVISSLSAFTSQVLSIPSIPS